MNREQTITIYRYINQRYALDRFEDKALDDLLKYYNTARKATLRDIKKAVQKNLSHKSQQRLNSLLKEIDDVILTLSEKVTKPVVAAIGEAGEYSYKNTADILSWGGQVEGFNNVSLTAAQVRSLITTEEVGGYAVHDWLWKALNEEHGALKAEISAARIRGVGYKSFLRELGSRYDNLFHSKTAKDNLETVVKSYIQMINAKSHKDIYEANKTVINKVEWSAIMENGNIKTGRGTCPRCMALDGKTYDSVASGPTCPLHPRCRCMYLPVTKTWKELGFNIKERRALGKKYNKWYERSPSRRRLAYGLTDKDFGGYWKTKPKWWQNNAIGVQRAEWVRSGKVKFNDITVHKKSQIKSIKKATGRSYELGELITVKDLAKWKKINVTKKGPGRLPVVKKPVVKKPVAKKTPPVIPLRYVHESSSNAVLRDYHKELIEGLPIEVRKKLMEHGDTFVIAEKTTAYRPDLANKRPRGYPAGMGYDSAKGWCTPGTKIIFTSEKYEAPGCGLLDVQKDDFRNTFYHETGHAIDNSLGKISKSDASFRRAYRVDKANMSSAVKADMSYFLQSGDTGPSEAFAESFLSVHTSPDDLSTRADRFRMAFPETVKEAEKIIKGLK